MTRGEQAELGIALGFIIAFLIIIALELDAIKQILQALLDIFTAIRTNA